MKLNTPKFLKTYTKIVFYLFFFMVFILQFSCEGEQSEYSEDISADLIFYIKQSSNCGYVTVNLDGYASKTIAPSNFTSTVPFCEDRGAVFKDVKRGNYKYSAFCDNNEISGTVTISENGCMPIFLDILKDTDYNNNNSGGNSSSNVGNIVFWVAKDFGCGPINVKMGVGAINGVPLAADSRTITSFFNQVPNCGSSGSASFNNRSIYTTYSYLAECNGKTWTGTVSPIGGQCKSIELKENNSNNTNNRGELMFWVSSDLGVGSITVVCNGATRTINSYYNITPNCGANGSANYNLPIGTYSYSASAGNATWNGSATVNSGGCTRIELTL